MSEEKQINRSRTSNSSHTNESYASEIEKPEDIFVDQNLTLNNQQQQQCQTDRNLIFDQQTSASSLTLRQWVRSLESPIMTPPLSPSSVFKFTEQNTVINEIKDLKTEIIKVTGSVQNLVNSLKPLIDKSWSTSFKPIVTMSPSTSTTWGSREGVPSTSFESNTATRPLLPNIQENERSFGMREGVPSTSFEPNTATRPLLPNIQENERSLGMRGFPQSDIRARSSVLTIQRPSRRIAQIKPRKTHQEYNLLRHCPVCNRLYVHLLQQNIFCVILRCTHFLCALCYSHLYRGRDRAHCPICDRDYHRSSSMIFDHLQKKRQQ